LNRTIEVTVEKDLLSKCRQWGTERVAENTGGKNAKAYDHNKKLPWDNLRANRYAVVAEVAVAQWLGFDPYALTWVHRKVDGKYDKSLHTDADIQYGKHKVEVRNTSHVSNPIPVKHKDIKADALVVQAYVETNEAGTPTGKVILTGYVKATTGKRVGTYNKELRYWNVFNKKPMFLFPLGLFPAGKKVPA
jgi:hypothetical protein